jgi:hypothetical protein
MDEAMRRGNPARLLPVVAFAAASALAQSPTQGFIEYPGHFKVQSPYNIPVAQRFSDTGGMYTTMVYPNDKPFEQGNPTEPRTEMRWDTWSDETVEHMYEADVMYESGCSKTCIMQVKSNTRGEAVYLRVLKGGDLIWLGNGATILKSYYNKWFNLKVAFNPKTSVGRVWIDDKLIHTNGYGSSKDWYFKNGTYTVESPGPAVAHFKNIKHRVFDPAAAQNVGVNAPRFVSPRTEAAEGAGLPVLTVYDLQGRSAQLRAGGRSPAHVIYLLPQR